MKTQIISRKDLKHIHDNVCNGWKSKIKTILSDNLWSDEIEISDQLILQGYSEADDDKKKLIKKYFTIPTKLIDQISSLKDVWERLGLKYEDVLVFTGKNLSQYQKHMNAKSVIFTVSNFLNQGWTPKFDGSQYNHYPWLEFNKRTGRWVCSYYYCVDTNSSGQIAYYKDLETAKKAFELLEEEYNIYLNTY